MSSALIVIDVQESFLQQPLWAASSNPGIAGRVGRLVSAARPRGDVATAHGPGAAARVARGSPSGCRWRSWRRHPGSASGP